MLKFIKKDGTPVMEMNTESNTVVFLDDEKEKEFKENKIPSDKEVKEDKE